MKEGGETVSLYLKKGRAFKFIEFDLKDPLQYKYLFQQCKFGRLVER